ncbi:MAG: hypothetical protein ACR2RL_15195, partial [Gammaproteobacteria bacterium]
MLTRAEAERLAREVLDGARDGHHGLAETGVVFREEGWSQYARVARSELIAGVYAQARACAEQIEGFQDWPEGDQ